MVGRDNKLNFWYGNWTRMGPLQKLNQGPLPREAPNWEVKDVMLDTRWDWDRMPFVFFVKNQIVAPSNPNALNRKRKWQLARVNNPRGNFDLKIDYKLAMGPDANMAFSENWIWESMMLPHIKTFLWKCAHESIGVKTCLKRRGMINNDCCPICQEEAETILHALRDCARVKTVWRQLGIQRSNHDFGCQTYRISWATMGIWVTFMLLGIFLGKQLCL